MVLRTCPAARRSADLRRSSVRDGLSGINGADRKVHSQVRALLTGYLLLHSLTGDVEYQAFSDPEVALGGSARSISTTRRNCWTRFRNRCCCRRRKKDAATPA